MIDTAVAYTGAECWCVES